MASFEWPWQYNFPPFFTLQPNLDTRRKQVDAWTSLILAYCRHHRKYTLDVAEALTSPLFNNTTIGRKLSPDTVYILLDDLQKKGHVEWTDKSRRQCLVMWRTPQEWAQLIYRWAADNGMLNTVCTLYELANGDDTVKEEFHGLDSWLLMRALKVLEQQKKAEVISLSGSEGVKFF
jgi:ESCRT-II complex subunit VPS25